MLSDLTRQFFEDLEKRMPAVAQLLPRRELEAALQSALAKMDLVTREEFDAQAAVLARTRQKLEALEKQLAQLEDTLHRNK